MTEMTGAVLRPATDADAASISECSRLAYVTFVERIGYEPKPMVEDYAAHIAKGRVWVLDRDGTVTGVLVLIPEDEHLLVYSVAVSPARQGEGIGRAMMEFAEKEAGRQGYPTVVLYTNQKMTGNIAFYERLGYERFDLRSHTTRPGSWLVFMRKDVRV